MTREELMREIDAAATYHSKQFDSPIDQDWALYSFREGALFLADRLMKAADERDHLRARISKLREALEKVKYTWGVSAKTYAERALAADKENE